MKNANFIPGDQYALSVQTGAIAAGASANSQLLAFRWSSSTEFAIVQEISCTGMFASTAFAAGAITLKATLARAYTANASGGTALEFGGDSHIDNAALRTTMGDSAVGEFRIATTAALTAGTQVLEDNDFGQITTHSSGGVGSATPIIGSIYLPTTTLFKANFAAGEYPLVLAQNEGFVIRATVPGTGVWIAGFTVKWAEVESGKRF